MSNAVFYNAYKLKEGTSVEDFLATKSSLTEQHVSKHKGWISSTYLRDGDTWADYSTWETMDDLKAFIAKSRLNPTDLAKRMYAFIDFGSSKSHIYTVERHITPSSIPSIMNQEDTI